MSAFISETQQNKLQYRLVLSSHKIDNFISHFRAKPLLIDAVIGAIFKKGLQTMVKLIK